MSDMTAITSNEDVDSWIAESGARWLFKHSNACSISFTAHDEVNAHLEANPDQPLGIVVIQDYRPVSNYVAQAVGRVHQSPQLFLLKDGQVAWAATHFSITAAAMKKAWDEAN